MFDTPGPADDTLWFEMLLSHLARLAVAGASPADMLDASASWADSPLLAGAGLVHDTPQQRRSLLRQLSRQVLDAMPQPTHDFALRRTPRPQRNDSCDCGSGLKYKHCCLQLEQGMPAIDRINMLPALLEAMPRRDWAQLAYSAVDPMAVADAADQFLQAGQPAQAIALLAPWFSEMAHARDAHEALFDTLLEAYDQNHNPRKKQQLLDAGTRSQARSIRSAAHQHLAAITSDRGDFSAAWSHFEQAQRNHPDNPALSHLEVLLLQSQGKPEQARQRARFWIARLRRNGDEHADLIAVLQQLGADGMDAAMQLRMARDPVSHQLAALLAQAPAVQALYRGQVMDDGQLTTLQPAPTLRRAMQAWHQEFDSVHPGLTSLFIDEHPAWDQPQPWLDALERNPVLWQSMNVIDDLVLALQAHNAPRDAAMLADTLLTRGTALLVENLAPYTDKPLEWGYHDNRPFLRLLAQHIAWLEPDDDSLSEAHAQAMAWMLRLNPNDNHGYRHALMPMLLRARQPTQALKLFEAYPDDPDLLLHAALAHYANGAPGKALIALQEAHDALPEHVAMLATRSPRKPTMTAGSYRFGGKHHAWIHRQHALPAWQAWPGALEWLTKTHKQLRISGKR